MDELKIKTNFMKSLIGKIISKVLYKNGILAETDIKELSVSHTDGDKVDITLSVNLKLAETDILNLIKKM